MSSALTKPDSDSRANAPDRTYLVECYWPGVTATKLAAAARRAANERCATCLELILVPADEIVLGLFCARSEAAVSDAARNAGLPSERIVTSIRVRPNPP